MEESDKLECKWFCVIFLLREVIEYHVLCELVTKISSNFSIYPLCRAQSFKTLIKVISDLSFIVDTNHQYLAS